MRNDTNELIGNDDIALKIVLTHEAEGFGVAWTTVFKTRVIWRGLLEDAIVTAHNEAENMGAANAEAWKAFAERHVCGTDMDELAKAILLTDSSEELFWAYDPADHT